MKTISPAQTKFIARLADERSKAVGNDATLFAALTEALGGTLTVKESSALIDALKALPRNAVPAAAKAVPGFYVTDAGEALRVVANKAGTGTYAKRFVVSGGKASWDYAPGVAATLAGLTPMDGPAAAAIGLKWNFCVRCCAALGGETLSAKVSAIVGYGAQCAQHEDWPFPKGVKAQRALVEAHAPATALAAA